MIYSLIINFPVIVASFDENPYVDGEIIRPAGNEYDFKIFKLNSSHTKNYNTSVSFSGVCQFLDDGGDHTINVLEWDKMSLPQRNMFNSSISSELEKPHHYRDGIKIIDIDFLSVRLYAAPKFNDDKNILIYVATPSEEDTVEMIKTLEFKDS